MYHSDAAHLAGPQHTGGEALADVAQPGRGEVGHQPPPVRGRVRGAHGATIYTSTISTIYTPLDVCHKRLHTADIRGNAAPRHQSPESPSALAGPGESCWSVSGYKYCDGSPHYHAFTWFLASKVGRVEASLLI